MVGKERTDDQFTHFFAEFCNSFGSPSSRHPNVRCVSRLVLLRELLDIRDRLAHASIRKTSGKALLKRLLDSGLVHPVDVVGPDHECPADEFYSVGLNGSTSELDPIELLQAIEPKGITCYFTAVHFHELSTQMPSHHHIARLTDASPRDRKPPSNTPQRRPSSRASSKKRDPLGRRQLLYGGIPYYITTRIRRRVPGFQQRYYTNKTIFSVTTIEQTLLDTLERPLSCGGTSVVFEAWESASHDLNQDRLLYYLEAIRDHRLSRRVGYMLHEHFQRPVDTKLENYLNCIRKHTSEDETVSVISLLPGQEYANTSPDWRLQVP